MYVLHCGGARSEWVALVLVIFKPRWSEHFSGEGWKPRNQQIKIKVFTLLYRSTKPSINNCSRSDGITGNSCICNCGEDEIKTCNSAKSCQLVLIDEQTLRSTVITVCSQFRRVIREPLRILKWSKKGLPCSVIFKVLHMEHEWFGLVKDRHIWRIAAVLCLTRMKIFK